MKIIKNNFILYAKLRKFLVLGTALCLISGCSSGNSSSVASAASKDKTIDVNGENTVDDYVSYNVMTVQAVTKIDPQNVSGFYTYQENKTDGNVYVDVVLKVKNLTSEDMDIQKDFTGKIAMEGKDLDTTVEGENDDNTSISQHLKIKPLAESVVHFYVDVPKDDASKDITFTFIANNVTASMKCNLSDESTMPKKSYINVGDKIGDTKVCEASFIGVEKTKDLSPKNPSSFYSHYTAKNGTTYLVAEVSYKNISGAKVSADKIGSMKVIVADKYNYNGMSCLEVDGDFEYSNITSIDPLETVTLYYYAEVPDEIIDKTYDITLYIDAIEYHITDKK